MSGQAKEGSKREFFPQLTSVRFFAALIVILYHYDAELKPYLPSLVWNFINHGYVGVSFFFVLSGFILAANYYDRLLDKTVSKSDFWWARFSRIYPLYILSILVVLPRLFLPAGMDPLPEQANYAHSHPFELFFVVVFALQSFAFPSGGYFNSPAWSISTEVFFYLCLPFMLRLIKSIPTRRLFITLVCLFIAAWIGPYFYHQHVFLQLFQIKDRTYSESFDSFLNQLVRMCFITRLPEFLSGIIAYRLYREVLRDNPKPIYGVMGFLASLPFIVVMFIEPNDNMLNTVLYTGQALGLPFFVFLILWLIMSKSKVISALSSTKWVLMGEASFALYLFHIPIKNAGQLIAPKLLHIEKDNALFALVLIAFSIWISIVLFNRVETPWRKRLAGWYKARQAKKAT